MYVLCFYLQVAMTFICILKKRLSTLLSLTQILISSLLLTISWKWCKQFHDNIISFLCSCIVTEIYRAYVIDFQSRVLSYEWINFNLNSEIDWISKHSHNSKINESFMNIMSVTLMFIRARDRNIFSRLLKMTFTINDLKSNESSSILMKQDMSMSLSITTLTKANHFSNSLQFHASELIQDSRVLYVLTSCIWSKVLF